MQYTCKYDPLQDLYGSSVGKSASVVGSNPTRGSPRNDCFVRVVLCCFVFLICCVALPCLSKQVMECLIMYIINNCHLLQTCNTAGYDTAAPLDG